MSGPELKLPSATVGGRNNGTILTSGALLTSASLTLTGWQAERESRTSTNCSLTSLYSIFVHFTQRE